MVAQLLLKESSYSITLNDVHENLLLRLVTLMFNSGDITVPATERYGCLQKVIRLYKPTRIVWARMFQLEASRQDSASDKQILTTVYEQWRQFDPTTATLALAQWALSAGEVVEAQKKVAEARSSMNPAEGLDFERRWTQLLQQGTSEVQ